MFVRYKYYCSISQLLLAAILFAAVAPSSDVFLTKRRFTKYVKIGFDFIELTVAVANFQYFVLCPQ